MQSKRTRLDRLISTYLRINRGDVRHMLAQGRVQVNGCIARDVQQLIDEFDQVILDGEVLQNKTPYYVMMNKPACVVSATKDEKHKTVIDLLDKPYRDSLHIVGRLDFNSTGLLLLTNDGRWSKRLTMPGKNVSKVYHVTVEKTLTEEYSTAFEKGMYFPFEDITTRPATLKIISDYVAEVSLVEGRYHQIKRMFGRFQNEVLELHRVAIGNLALDVSLAPEQSRELTAEEVRDIFC